MTKLGEMKVLVLLMAMAFGLGICSCALHRKNEVLVAYQTVSYTTPMPDRMALLNDSLKNQILSFEQLNPKGTLGAKISTKTMAVEEMCDSLHDFMESIKEYVVEFEGLQSYEDYLQSRVLTNPKDFSPGNSLLTTSRPHVRPLADSLQTSINLTRKRMVKLFWGLPNVNEELEFMLTLRAEDNPKNSNPERRLWTRNIFHDMPKGAVIALIKKFQNDTLNSKREVYSELLRILETNE